MEVPMILLFDLLLFIVHFGCSTEIFELYSNYGEIDRNSLVGSPVSFDSPLRISRKINNTNINLSIVDPKNQALFELHPTLVGSGDSFTLLVRSPINVSEIDVKISALLSPESNVTEEELLHIEVVDGQQSATPKAHKEVLELDQSDYRVNVNVLESNAECPAGKVLQLLKIQNAEAIRFEDYGFVIEGKYAELFQLDAMEKSESEKFLEFKLAENCRDLGELTRLLIAEHDERIPPLVLQISAMKSEKSKKLSAYLIQLDNSAPTLHNNSNGTVERSAILDRDSMQVEVTEKSHTFSPIFRLRALRRGEDAGLRGDYTFMIADSGDSANALGPRDVLELHPKTGVFSIKASENLTVENFGSTIKIPVNLLQDENLIDTAEAVIQINSVQASVGNSNSGDNEAQPFRFEQSVYAFAVGPGMKEVGRIRVFQPLDRMVAERVPLGDSSIRYAISEGGASYFRVDERTGQLIYEGPLEKNAKNYTIKAIAYDAMQNAVESASVQVLVAGIGSSPPQLMKKYDVVEIVDDLSLDRVIYALRAVDLDPDARLYYSIVSINCLSVLGQPLDDDCRTLVQFGNRGVRNGSLILTADPRRTDEDVDGHRGDISDIVQFVRRKTRAIASAFVNVSVADLNHPLEPSENALLVIRIVQAPPSAADSDAQSSLLNSGCRLKFDRLRKADEIFVDDSLPPSSYIYSISVCPLSFMELEKFWLPRRSVNYSLVEDGAEKFFAIDSTTGVIRSITSLKGVVRQNVTVVATDFTSGQGLDKITLFIVCRNMFQFAPNFTEQFYSFTVNQTDMTAEPIGRVHVSGIDAGGAAQTSSLIYEIIDLDFDNGANVSFTINDQGQIFAMLSPESSYSDIRRYYFFVRVVDGSSGKAAVVPATISVLPDATVAPLPRFSDAVPSLAVVMENSAPDTFVADLGATNVQNFFIYPSSNAPQQDAERAVRLAAALSAAMPSGTVRTSGSLVGLDGTGYWLTVVGTAADGCNVTTDLQVDVVPTSKCMPEFVSDYPLVYTLAELKPGLTVGAVTAKIDAICELYYSLDHRLTNDSSNQSPLFEIHPTSGAITVSNTVKSVHLGETDGRGVHRFSLIVVAKSGHVSTRVNVEVRVTEPSSSDSTNLLPVFVERDLLFRVLEDAPAGTVVGKVNAQCHDYRNLSANYRLLDTFDGRFSIEPSDGVIHIVRSLDFDDLRPSSRTQFDLKVFAICGDLETDESVEFHVELLDLNDNDPRFEHTDYEFSLEKEAQIGTIVGRAAAYDIDALTDALHYSLRKTAFFYHNGERRLRDTYFDVDASSGNIRLRGAIRDFSGGVFQLEIDVSDAEERGRNASTTVKIWICESSDIVPIVVAENPTKLNQSRVDEILRIMGTGSASRVLVHDGGYRTLHAEAEVLRDFTVLRLLFIDATTVVSPVEVERRLHDVQLPEEVKAADDKDLSISGTMANEGSVGGRGFVGDGAAVPPPFISTLLFPLTIFGALLCAICALLCATLCYYRRRYADERDHLRDARIAKSAMQSGGGPRSMVGTSSTIRQFTTTAARSSMSDSTRHKCYASSPSAAPPPPPVSALLSNPYLPENLWESASNPSDGFNYYSTQEMKISMR